MPEGPELFLASRFINNVCRGRVFSRIVKSDISKNPVVQPPAERYIISSSSRGKEIKITLVETPITQEDDKKAVKKSQSAQRKSLDILFTFGLAGKFDFHEATELQKHAHLNFFTGDAGPKMVLSFVDYMRFGKWTPGADFSKERGPCVLFDYSNFRDNVFKCLDNAAFNKPICEVLLNQKYFNGIGNYLRAEILHRAKIAPFVSARSVLEPLAVNGESKVKSENPDILQLCNVLPQEVISLESSWYDGKDRSDDSNAFNSWLQCYYQDGMKNIADHNKRTIWYSGPLGPLVPKDIRVRGKIRAKSKKKSSESEEETGQINKTTSKRSQLKRDPDTADEDSASSGTKKPRLSKPAKTKRGKKANKAKEEAEDENSIADNKQEKLRTKRRKPARKVGDVSGVNDLPQDLKDRVETGRFTRGKIREIVDAIEDISEKKTKVNRKKVGSMKEKNGDESEGKVKAVKVGNGDDISKHGALGMTARTKTKARSQKQVNSGSAHLENKKSTQKMKLKTPRKRSVRRLSVS